MKIFMFKMVAVGALLFMGHSVNAQYQLPLEDAAVIYDEIPVPKKINLQKIKPENIFSVEVYKPESQTQLDSLKCRYGIDTRKGVVVIKTNSFEYSKNDTLAKNEVIYDVVEQMPRFSQGEEGLKNYIARNLKWPPEAAESCVQGAVYLRFVVMKNGRIGKIQLLRSLDPSFDKEAVRLVQHFPTWIPGMQNGKNVNVWYTMPVKFKLE